MKANITSGNNWITINGLDYERGSISALEEYGTTGVKIYPENDNPFVITADGSTGDGELFSDQAALMSFMQQYAPMDGLGGDTATVYWDDVRNKPLHTLGTPIEDAEGMVAVYTQGGQLPVGNPQFPENATPLYLVQFLIEEAYNNSKATVQEIQEGTNDEKHITPYLLKTFVEWFSARLLITDETYTESPTSAQVNEKYPNALVRTTLYLPNAGSGMKYTKLNATDWESMPYTIA